jgi:hypothetical protein
MKPCAMCCLHAVRQGFDWQHMNPDELIGQEFRGGQIHEAVTTFNGTDVCWYHIDDCARANGQ